MGRKIITCFVFIASTINLLAQPVQFNKRYNFSFDDAASNIIEKNNLLNTLVYSHDSASQTPTIHFLQLDSIGNIITNKPYVDSTSGAFYYTVHGLSNTNDGGYIAVYGNKLIKFNALGDTIWTKSDSSFLYGTKVIQIIDGGYAILYSIFATVKKTDSFGNLLWDNYFTLSGFGGSLKNLIELPSGELILCGDEITTQSPSCESGIGILIKTDSLGNEIIRKSITYNNQGNSGYFNLSALLISNDNHIISGGVQASATCAYDFYPCIIKLDTALNIVFQKVLSSDGMLTDIKQNIDSSFIASGYHVAYGGDAFLIKYNSSGDSIWQKFYNSPFCNSYRELQKLSLLNDGGIISTGYVYTYDTCTMDAWIIKLDSAGNCNLPSCLTSVSSWQKESAIQLNLFPNPVNNEINFSFGDNRICIGEVSVIDITGKLVVSKEINFSHPLSVKDIPSGLYFVKVIYDENVYHKKFYKN